MMKKIHLLLPLCAVLLFGFNNNQLLANNNQSSANNNQSNGQWSLIWEDNFDGPKLDEGKWVKLKGCGSGWCKYMSTDPRAFAFENGNLLLKAMVNPEISSADPRKYWTGGITTLGKFAFTYGKVEVRVKLENAQGAWPAIWVLPRFDNYGGYPKNGEIDMMEHLNHDKSIYQTVHSYYTSLGNKTNPPHSKTPRVDVSQFNTYGLEWHPDKLIFSVNGKKTFSYPRLPDLNPGLIQWPFDKPFYLLIDQQLGGSWVGKINPSQLPVNMVVDYARVYKYILPDTTGYYHIKSLNGEPNGLCMAAAKNNESVMTETCTEGLAEQLWKLDKGFLKNGNGRCLAVEGMFQNKSGHPVIVWDCNNGNEQKWTLLNNKTLINASGLCLDIPGAQDGAQLIIYTCHAAKNQQWEKHVQNPPDLTHYHHIKSLNVEPNGLCMTAVKNGQSVRTEKCETGLKEQLWLFENGHLKNGDGRCLAVEGMFQNKSGHPVIVWDCNNGKEQKWTLLNNKTLINASGLCLDIPGTQDGDPLIIYNCHAAKNQQWEKKIM